LLASQYFEDRGRLPKKIDMGINLLYVTQDEAHEIMKEVHGRECGPHMNGRMIAKKVQRLGYYWSIMEGHCYAYVRRCHNCQVYA